MGYRFVAPVWLVAPVSPLEAVSAVAPPLPPKDTPEPGPLLLRHHGGRHWSGLWSGRLHGHRAWQRGPLSMASSASGGEVHAANGFHRFGGGPLTLSPDGHMLAFIRGGNAFLTADQIYVKMLPNGEARRVTDDSRSKYGLAFSPDGSEIGVHGNGCTWPRVQHL